MIDYTPGPFSPGAPHGFRIPNGCKYNNERYLGDTPYVGCLDKMKRFCVILIIVVLCGGCAHSHTGWINLNSSAWMQTSEEYRAVSLGAYSMARQNLDNALEDRTWTALPSQVPTNGEQASALGKLPPAVIVDIDEAILSTLPYQAWLTKNNRPFTPESWNVWISEANAEAIPGALEFMQYTREKGVTVFYISNRAYRGPLDRNANGRLDPGEEQVDLKPFTIANLLRLGFLPQQNVSNDDALLLRGETGDDGRFRKGWGSSDKTARRESLSSGYRILLIMGDDLNDFTDYRNHWHGTRAAVSDDPKHSRNEHIDALDRYRAHWGRSWIMLPNPIYGSWERRLYGLRRTLSDEEKIKIKMDRLDTWQ